MPEDWSREEVAATVAAYFEMLNLEIRRESFNKREYSRRLQPLLRGRSAGAIEFKHANISAVMIGLGLPYISGYKPRTNFQELLKTEVIERLEQQPELHALLQTVVDAQEFRQPGLLDYDGVFVPAPIGTPGAFAYDRRQPTITTPYRVNYLEREARNAALGSAGEAFVLDVEHHRLWRAGYRRLAERIEHVSATRGDGLGYDIVSFEDDGRERLIEVKTTSFGSMTPFFASAREVAVSEASATEYHLYRVFEFREYPRIFTLQGSIRENCLLDAVQYRASVG